MGWGLVVMNGVLAGLNLGIWIGHASHGMMSWIGLAASTFLCTIVIYLWYSQKGLDELDRDIIRTQGRIEAFNEMMGRDRKE